MLSVSFSKLYFASCRVRLGSRHDPFKILGLSRSASKEQVKAKYRELAQLYHPDSANGDSGKMEEVNHAYKLLMKDGGFERLHLADDAQASSTRSRMSSQVRSGSCPFNVEQHTFSESTSSPFADSEGLSRTASNVEGQPLSEEEVERLSALDAGTERRTPRGTYLYQNRDDGSWVELRRPLLRADQPRYGSFTSADAIATELRRRSMATEKVLNERTLFERVTASLANTGDLPTRNKSFLRLYIILLLFATYLVYQKTTARPTHMSSKRHFYNAIEKERQDMLTLYTENKSGVELSVVAAAAIFLAASAHKKTDDPVYERPHEVVYHDIKPPPDHFHLASGT